MGRKTKDGGPPELPAGRDFEAIGRTASGECERYCVKNVRNLDEAREELVFQVRNLKTILFRIKP